MQNDRYTAEKDASKKPQNRCCSATYFIKEKNLMKWYLITVSPFFLLILLALLDRNVVHAMPSFGMMQCGNYKTAYQYYASQNVAMVFFINYEFLLCIAFFICIFIMRNIKDEFSINSELRSMTTMLFISDFLYIASLIFINNTNFVSLGGCQYIELFLCISLLTITAIIPIKKSY